MPPRARKTAAPAKNTNQTEDQNVSDEVTVDVETEDVAEAPEKKKRGGRVASPLTAAIRRHEKAVAKLKSAQAKADKVQDVADALAAAVAEEEAAKAELLAAVGV